MAETVTTLEQEPVPCGACGTPAKYVEDGACIGTPDGRTEYIVTQARYCCPASDCGAAGPIRRAKIGALRAWNRMWERPAQLLRDAEPKDAEPDAQVNLNELGSIAYGAAMVAFWSGGNHPFGTRTLPWDELEPSVQRGWIAAAVAVMDRMPADKPLIGPATKRVLDLLNHDAEEFIKGMWIDVDAGKIDIGKLNADLITAALRECGMEDDSR